MRERIYRTEALILRRTNIGEADRVLVLAMPDGKRRVIARGVRKTTSRLAGHLELFTRAHLLLARGRNLDIVTQSQVLDDFRALRADLARLGRAYYAADLYDRFIQDDEENPALFRLLCATYAALDVTRNPDLALRAYELRLLHLAGYRPHLHRCAICQTVLPEQADRFSPTFGGVLCPGDAPADRAALPMKAATFRLLRYLQSEPLDAIEPLRISEPIHTQAEMLLHAYIVNLLEGELRSQTFLESLRAPGRLPAAPHDYD
jgi:DNA repair protein RecO (recombination protein O)